LVVVGIKNDGVEAVWGRVEPLLKNAVGKSQGDYSVADIKDCLLSRGMQLWIWVVDDKIEACCITQIMDYPRRRVLQLPFIAGAGMKDWLKAEKLFEAYAISQGCTQFEGFCRKGWTRVLKDWKIAWITMRKEL